MRREIDLSINKREQVFRMINSSSCLRAFRWASITFAHSFQKNRFIAAVMDYLWVGGLREDTEEVVPDQLLLIFIFRPETVLRPSLGSFNPNPDQVVEITIGNPFDIQKDQGAFEFGVGNTNSTPCGVGADEMCRIIGLS